MAEKQVIKCSSCGKLLAKGHINDGELEIKCKCGTVNTIAREPKQSIVLIDHSMNGITIGSFGITQISE